MPTTLMDVYKMEGISNLPMKVRIPFAKAWLAENEGRASDAAAFLDAAVEAEKALAEEAKK